MIHSLTHARAWLMILGIFIHAGQVYHVAQSWLVKANEQSPAISMLIDFLSLFRMPSFFIIAGFFLVYSSSNKSLLYVAKHRTIRLLVPLATVMLTLNLLQYVLLHPDVMSLSVLSAYFSSGSHVQHLWFLINLIVYQWLIFVIWALRGGQLLQKWLDAVDQQVGKWLWGCVLLFPFAYLATLALNKLGIPLYIPLSNSTSLFSLLTYLPFYLFGLLLGRQGPTYFAVTRGSLFFPLVCGVGLFYLQTSVRLDQGLLDEAVAIYLKMLLSWSLSIICIRVFFRFFSFSHSITNEVADSAYTIYLFHHLIVVGLALLFTWLVYPAWVEFLLISLLTLVITLLIHRYFVSRHAITQFLFLGKI